MTTNWRFNLIFNISKQTSHEYPPSPLSHKWDADRATLLKLCRSLIRSNWYYGCIVYGPAPKTSLAELDSIHIRRFRLSLGEFRSHPVESWYVEAHEPPLFIIETHIKNYLCSNWMPLQEIRFMMLCVFPNSGIDTQSKKRLWISLAYVSSNY